MIATYAVFTLYQSHLETEVCELMYIGSTLPYLMPGAQGLRICQGDSRTTPFSYWELTALFSSDLEVL